MRGLQHIIDELKAVKDAYLDGHVYEFKQSVLMRMLETTDENNVVLTSGTILQHLHGEIRYDDKNYFLVDSEWYQIHPAFISDLNKECTELLDQVWDESLITHPFDVKKESDFNLKFCGNQGWLVFDTITPENIECCDLL